MNEIATGKAYEKNEKKLFNLTLFKVEKMDLTRFYNFIVSIYLCDLLNVHYSQSFIMY